MELSLLQPVMALLLLAVPLVWFLPPRPRPVHGVIRTTLLALAILALTKPVLIRSAAQQHYAIVLDQSGSIEPTEREAGARVVDDVLGRLAAGQTATVVQIGGTEAAMGDAATVWLRDPAGDPLGHSPLGDALTLAAQSIPTGLPGAVVLVSDGRGTDRHWGRPLAQLQERGIPVHTVQLSARETTFLTKVRASRARPGESVRLAADVVGSGEGLEVVVLGDASAPATSGAFDCAGRCSVAVEFPAGDAGFSDISVELRAPGENAPSSTAHAVVAVQEPLRVLYIGDRQRGAGAALGQLLGSGFVLEAVRAEEVGAGFGFAAYDVVLLDDAPATALAADVQRRLAQAVQHSGIGLLASGGAAAFADGGYHGTPVAEILPVAITGEEEKVDPSVGLAIIIDTSGSMAGTRIELAKQIARIAVRRLQPHDRIGIVEFYGAKHWAVPMQPASNKIEIDRAIGRMKAIGGTVLYPAIQEAYYGLKNVNTRYKHILLITDAGVEDSNYERMVRRISRDRINVSTTLVGQGGHNLIMSDIANWGQGRFYSVGDPFSLVELILKQPSTRKPPRYKRGAFAVTALGGAGWWGGVRPQPPELLGYAEVEPRPGAELLLVESGSQDPVLASWRYGLGRVTALTTEPVGEGTAGWRDWTRYGAYLGRVIARSAADRAAFDVSLTRRHHTVALAAERMVPGAAHPAAKLVDATGAPDARVAIAFRETAPGLFEAEFAWPPGEPVRIEVVAAAQGGTVGLVGPVQRIALPATSDVAPEAEVDPLDALDLERLAARTGGVHLASADATPPAGAIGDWLASNRGELSFVVTRLWPLLLLLALLLYLGDLLYRRWPRGGGR